MYINYNKLIKIIKKYFNSIIIIIIFKYKYAIYYKRY